MSGRPEAAALAVFARPPRPGRAKTRLAASLGGDAAARLYGAFVEDTLRLVRRLRWRCCTLWCADDADDPTLCRLAHSAKLRRRGQRGEDLGERLRAAIDDGLQRAPASLAIGSDAPTLPPAYLTLACERLARADVVLGPAVDGGFYLVGQRAPQRAIFSGVRWSSRHALTDTIDTARKAGARVALLPPWYDIDTEQDLLLLRTHLALEPWRAPASARVLGLLEF